MIRNKARLVAHGYTHEEGIYYDEVFAPVARIEAIRLFLAYASFKDFVMDVKSAFYGKIEKEICVCQPPGFEDPDFPNRVYKVEKALYGLLQALELASTPMDTHKTLLKYIDGEVIDEHLYRSMIGSLMYLTFSRPDIMFADSPFDLVAYTDGDYAGTNLDRKSTTGAEYIVASNCCRQSTICIVKNPVFHSKTKYIEIRHHFIRDSSEKKLIQMIKIHTDKNVVDLLTKAFDVSKFQYLIASIGMLNL
ncbi:putative reverse transcriptase, RNA-dependent DNA polymerase [Tanacetum coccineum]